MHAASWFIWSPRGSSTHILTSTRKRQRPIGHYEAYIHKYRTRRKYEQWDPKKQQEKIRTMEPKKNSSAARRLAHNTHELAIWQELFEMLWPLQVLEQQAAVGGEEGGKHNRPPRWIKSREVRTDLYFLSSFNKK
jgi:hypothetical protein